MSRGPRIDILLGGTMAVEEGLRRATARIRELAAEGDHERAELLARMLHIVVTSAIEACRLIQAHRGGSR